MKIRILMNLLMSMLVLSLTTACATPAPQVTVTVTAPPPSASAPGDNAEVERCEKKVVSVPVAVIGDCKRPTIEVIGQLQGNCESASEMMTEWNRCEVNLLFQNKTKRPVSYAGKVCAVIDGADYVSYYPDKDTGYINPGDTSSIYFVMYGGKPGSKITSVYLGDSCDSSANGYKYIEGYGEFVFKNN